MRTARPYRRRTGSRKRKISPNGTYPAAGAAAQENDSLPADVPCLCRVHVPDIRTLRQRGRECGKRGRLQCRHTPARRGRIIADKQKAYEQAVTSRKQQDKIQSLQDFGFTLDDDTEEPQEEINLLPEEDPKPQRGGGASSRAAYRDINRQLSTFYETPPVDEEKEELKRQVAELTDRLKQQQNATLRLTTKWHSWKSPTSWRQST